MGLEKWWSVPALFLFFESGDYSIKWTHASSSSSSSSSLLLGLISILSLI
ncbi:hypothetical protein LguiB_026978 [Lonicera macranthoides]